MEDLFYFSKTCITLDDIRLQAKKAGYRCTIFTNSDRWLNVYYNDHDFWQWSEFHEDKGDFDALEPLQQKKIAAFQPLSALVVSHHITSLPDLVVFLQHILKCYGGWVGCDDGIFQATYDHQTIEKLHYPYTSCASVPNP